MKAIFSLVTLEIVLSSLKKSERSKPMKISSLKNFYDQFPGVFSENEDTDEERSTHHQNT